VTRRELTGAAGAEAALGHRLASVLLPFEGEYLLGIGRVFTRGILRGLGGDGRGGGNDGGLGSAFIHPRRVMAAILMEITGGKALLLGPLRLGGGMDRPTLRRFSARLAFIVPASMAPLCL